MLTSMWHNKMLILVAVITEHMTFQVPLVKSLFLPSTVRGLSSTRLCSSADHFKWALGFCPEALAVTVRKLKTCVLSKENIHKKPQTVKTIITTGKTQALITKCIKSNQIRCLRNYVEA